MSFKRNVLDNIESVRNQISTGEQKKVLFENKFQADLCVICCPYINEELLKKYVGSRINSSAIKKIVRICNYGEENWAMILVKDKSVIFYCFLPYIQIKNPELDNMMIKQIKGEKFGFIFLKVDSERNLQLIGIE